MTRGSILEYVEAIRGWYLSVSRKEKGRILDEFTNVTGLHRKAAIRLLHRRGRAKVKRRRGWPRCYSHDVVSALRVVWEATDRLCSKRLHPFLSEVLVSLKGHGEITLTPEVETQLYLDKRIDYRPVTASLPSSGRSASLGHHEKRQSTREVYPHSYLC